MGADQHFSFKPNNALSRAQLGLVFLMLELEYNAMVGITSRQSLCAFMFQDFSQHPFPLKHDSEYIPSNQQYLLIWTTCEWCVNIYMYCYYAYMLDAWNLWPQTWSRCPKTWLFQAAGRSESGWSKQFLNRCWTTNWRTSWRMEKRLCILIAIF